MVQTAVQNDQQYVLITPLKTSLRPPVLAVRASILFRQPGYTYCENDHLIGVTPGRQFSVHITGKRCEEAHLQLESPHISVMLDEPIAVSTDCAMSVEEVTDMIAQAKASVYESAEQ